jgi:hypothetical protein
MWLGIKNVISANHMISLITSSTTDPELINMYTLSGHWPHFLYIGIWN